MARVLTPLILLVALLAVASLLAMSTNPAGIGVWASDTVSFEGVLRVDPYAEVITADGRAMLIVDAGKGGIRDGIGAHEGELVRVEGFPISRVGHSVLELLPGEAGLTPLGPLMGGAALDRPSGDAVIVRGEVLDLKCFLGAMKPGRGVTHRGCAVLCVQGGVPPAIMGRDGFVEVLVSDAWGAMNERLLDHVGTVVEIRGVRAVRDGIPYLAVMDLRETDEE